NLITEDFSSGRMVDVINKGEPACFLTHWPGMYANGTGIAFRTFQGIVKRLNAGFPKRIRWMKLTEIARYWAAKELTAIKREGESLKLHAPFGTPGFTLQLSASIAPKLQHGGKTLELSRAKSLDQLTPGTWIETPDEDGATIACFDLEKGETTIS
ncbi:MAG: hypothetical protein AAF585_23790, partial [Verrucomicrobiota bacterium]